MPTPYFGVWIDAPGATTMLSVLATTGAALPGHPTVMVERFGGVGVDAAGTIFVQFCESQ